MDDQKENDDLRTDQDDTMSQGIKVDVETDDSNIFEPEINNIQPPAESSVGDTGNEGENSAATAVNFIAGADASSTEGAETVSSDAAPHSDDENANSVVEEPAVVKAFEPEEIEDTPSTDEQISSTESGTSSIVDNTAPVSTFSAQQITQSQSPVEVSGMSNNEQTLPHEHRNNKKLAVIIILFVALFLVSTLIYVYISAQNNAEETTNTTGTNEVDANTSDIVPASTEDIDQTINEIDQTVESLDDTDLTEEAISDDTLGL